MLQTFLKSSLRPMRPFQPSLFVRHFEKQPEKTEQQLQEEDAMYAAHLEDTLKRNSITVLPEHASDEITHTTGKDVIPHPEECNLVSGVGDYNRHRKIVIAKPSKHFMQAGTYHTKHWEIRFTPGSTWENPLMGWTSSADPLYNMVLPFDSKEEAIGFAQRQGWEYEIDQPAEKPQLEGKLSYSYRFLPLKISNEMKTMGKKRATTFFKHRKGGHSHWVKTLNYHGTDVVKQHGGEAKE